MLKIRYNACKEVIYVDVGPYIKQLRTERKMSQEELGVLIGVKRAAVQKWECGRVQNLKRDTIKKLSEIFGVNASAFVGGDITDYTPTITEDYVKYPVNKQIRLSNGVAVNVRGEEDLFYVMHK